MRIKLRRIKESDKKDIQINMNDKTVTRYTGWRYPFSLKDAEKFINNYARETREGKSYARSIEYKKKAIGTIAFVDMENGSAAIDFWIGRNYWSRGFGTEALKKMLALGFGKLGLVKVYASAYAPNKASNSLLEKVGFRLYQRRKRSLKGRKTMQLSYMLEKKQQ